jgi:hypothetical protein
LPLNKIKLLLRRSRSDLSTALRAQRTLLEQKRGLLERTMQLLVRLKRRYRSTVTPTPRCSDKSSR